MTALNWDRAKQAGSQAAGWRSQPATRKQLDYIGVLCGWPSEHAGKGLTRGQASDLIAELRTARDADSRRPRPA